MHDYVSSFLLKEVLFLFIRKKRREVKVVRLLLKDKFNLFDIL